jgi:hypothetical protein
MLNLVEMGLREEERDEHVKAFADLVMEEAGIRPYEMRTTSSEVYGTTVDILVEGYDFELGSGAMDLTRSMRPGHRRSWVGIGLAGTPSHGEGGGKYQKRSQVDLPRRRAIEY